MDYSDGSSDTWYYDVAPHIYTKYLNKYLHQSDKREKLFGILHIIIDDINNLKTTFPEFSQHADNMLQYVNEYIDTFDTAEDIEPGYLVNKLDHETGEIETAMAYPDEDDPIWDAILPIYSHGDDLGNMSMLDEDDYREMSIMEHHEFFFGDK